MNLDTIVKLKCKLASSEFVDVLNDMVVFTGMPVNDVCHHIIGSGSKVKQELLRVKPAGPMGLELFYRCCREYLFLNAYRVVWLVMQDNLNDPSDGPVLDFAGGMGNDSVWLALNEYDVDYHEISMIQREFVKTRARARKLKIGVIDPYIEGRYEPLKCIKRTYGVVMFRDVLEHAPKYVELMNVVCSHVRAGGLVLEHTPWANLKVKKSPLHLNEGKPLGKVFKSLGFKPVTRGVWRKT